MQYSATRFGWAMRCLSVLAMTGLAVMVAADGALAQFGQFGERENTSPHESFSQSSQAGIRLGGWANRGATPADSVGLDPLAYYVTDFSDANFYLEGFFAYRFNSYLMGELSVGIVSRGDVTLRDEALQESRYGSLLVYPILVKAKLYPVGVVGDRFHPYLLAGGGIYYGRHDVQIVSTQSAFYTAFNEAAETDFSYVLGGGFDWPLSSVVGLDLNIQYMPIEFSNDLIAVRDYSSVTVTVGVKYLFNPSGKEKR